MIDMNRVLFCPQATLIGKTVMIPEALEDAIAQAGIEEAAEKEGSPLNELAARIFAREYGNGDDIAEFAGRQCYRSWKSGRTADKYIENVIDQGHGSVFQHAQLVLQITGVSRSLTHELVRHGTGTGFSQESQRYVDAKDIQFVLPPITEEYLRGKTEAEIEADPEMSIWRTSCRQSLENYVEYQSMIAGRLRVAQEEGNYKDVTEFKKRANEAARSLLPNAAETRLVFSANLRSIRHILSLRGTAYADLEIQRLSVLVLGKIRDYAPEFFREVQAEVGPDGRAIINALNGKV